MRRFERTLEVSHSLNRRRLARLVPAFYRGGLRHGGFIRQAVVEISQQSQEFGPHVRFEFRRREMPPTLLDSFMQLLDFILHRRAPLWCIGRNHRVLRRAECNLKTKARAANAWVIDNLESLDSEQAPHDHLADDAHAEVRRTTTSGFQHHILHSRLLPHHTLAIAEAESQESTSVAESDRNKPLFVDTTFKHHQLMRRISKLPHALEWRD